MSTEPAVQVSAPELGYCHQCQQPAKVVALSVRAWTHRLWICSACLGRLARVVEQG